MLQKVPQDLCVVMVSETLLSIIAPPLPTDLPPQLMIQFTLPLKFYHARYYTFVEDACPISTTSSCCAVLCPCVVVFPGISVPVWDLTTCIMSNPDELNVDHNGPK